MSSRASLQNQTSLDIQDRELQVLEHIAVAQNVRQRDIAQIIGMSLGMTNAILKRLARKGFITMRKVNNRNIMYAVSAAGFEQIARRSYRYFRRTIRNVVVYKKTIESLVLLVASQGFTELTVVDESDLDFIIEHACRHAGIRFTRVAAIKRATADSFILYSERHEPPAGRRDLKELEQVITQGARETFLSELLI
jgi:DNA-binding MarR family transcriptional regulator